MASQSTFPPAPSLDELTFPLEGFHEMLRNNLFSMWQTSQFCDLILKVPEGELIPVHSCLMAALSPTIRDILFKVDGHFLERGEFAQKYVTVDVQKFSARVMKIIVFSIYTGQLVVAPPEIMEQLLKACRWLKMEHLIVVLEKAMKDSTNSSDDKAGMASNSSGFLSSDFTDGGNYAQDVDDETSDDAYSSSYTAINKNDQDSNPLQASLDKIGSCGVNVPDPPPFSKILPSNSAILNEFSSSQGEGFSSNNTEGQSVSAQNNLNSLGETSNLDEFSSNDNEILKQKNESHEDDATVTQSSTATTTSSQRNDASGSRQLRKGTRPRKKSQKWAENFFNNCLYSYEKTFLEAVVPQIKTEVDDLSTYLKYPMTVPEQMESKGDGGSRGAGMDATKKRKVSTGAADMDHDDADNDDESETNVGSNAASSSFNYMTDRFSLMDYYEKQNFNAMPSASTSFVNNSKSSNDNVNQMMDFSKKNLNDPKKRKGRKSVQFPLDKRRKTQFPIYKKKQNATSDVAHLSNNEADDDDGAASDSTIPCTDEQSIKDEDNGDVLRSSIYGRVKRKKRKATKAQNDSKQQGGDGERRSGPKARKSKSDAAESLSGAEPVKVKKRKVKELKVKLKLKVKKEKKTKKKSKIGVYVNRIIKPSDASNALDDMKQAENDILTKITSGETAKCIRCGVWFRDANQYADHITNHPIFDCPDCPTQFYLKRNLTRHRFTIHMDKSYLQCKECSFQAKTAIELCRHSGAEHDQPKPFKCENAECTFRATTYSDVQRHFKEIHTTELEYFCEKCGAGFTYKSLFTYHVQRCLKNETHLCYKCGATFHAKADLTSHIAAVHFNIRKYKCPKCDHRFASTSNLKRHLYIHNDVYPYTCPRCGKRFRHSNSYKAHMEKMHNNNSNNNPSNADEQTSSNMNMNSINNVNNNMNTMSSMTSMNNLNNMNMGAGPDVTQAAMNLSFLVAQGIRGWP